MLSDLRKSYDVNYAKNGFIQFDAARTLIEFVNTTNVNKVLDIGCGSGLVTKLLHSSLKPKILHAIDQSEVMIEQAKKNCQVEGVRFENVAIESYESQEKYDAIISNSSFLWFSNFELALRNIKCALADEGEFYIQTSYTHRWCPEFIDIVEEIKSHNEDIREMFSYHQFPCFYLDNEQEYSSFFHSHGLALQRFMAKDFEYELSAEDGLKVFNSGPIKAYADPKYFTKQVDKQCMSKFYDLVAEKIYGYRSIKITYPRAFMLVKKL
ncbi:class I SAM-dependent methyltransferase [Vibrio sp. S4M6]|uniref:class I SAM-dependent methyltransferase n=1 Tax=Vibrio sinus TaxID=2946865 RepID=UPI00202A4A4B|nr:class I SAM-dependent methyltransferase [Vibrio sinus]MCL9781122.1 class I SAM-dependent methyltransferase [Vibrio sinus]